MRERTGFKWKGTDKPRAGEQAGRVFNHATNEVVIH